VSQKTRVLFISSPLTLGADNAVNFMVLEHLDRARFELHAAGQVPPRGVKSPAWDALAAIDGVRVRPTDFGPSFFDATRLEKLKGLASTPRAAASLAGLALYVRSNGIQILHSTDRPRDAITCAGLARLTGAKSVIHVHVKFDTWVSKGVQAALRNADALVGVSEFVCQSLVAGGFDGARAHAVLNAVDPARWNPDLDPRIGRDSLGISPGTPIVVSVARLFSWKGHAELVRAFALAQAGVPDARLVIVGADYPEGSGTTETLKSLARDLGVLDKVIFTGQRRDVPALLAASDVFALPSFEEPFGLVFAEAMAMRKPVVALSNGGTLEVVEHGKCGLLSAPNDIRALADNLVTLLRDPALRRQYGEHGRARVLERFTPARLANDVAAVYGRLLDGASQQRL
jgi:glycosyltransferase involved in cell wall biosynthesis